MTASAPENTKAEHPAPERHLHHRVGWLRAAVLGANDGIVSTSSLMIGVAAAGTDTFHIALAGVAGLVAGAMSMASGEFVSVSSQSDTEKAELAREAYELENYPEREHAELRDIYVERGLDKDLADQVARQLMREDALGVHAREELGLSETMSARPIQAALTSALSFSLGAGIPLLALLFVPSTALIAAISIVSLLLLAVLGALSAYAGGAPVLRAMLRVTVWGALAMVITALIGSLFGTAT